ncbi:MAG: hypothetical protein FWH12_00045 [Treponema sp.]|nr:hypothetical protein [Treponema sp.]
MVLLSDLSLMGDLLINLERIAEIERSGSFNQGLAFQESELREKSGDLGGAAVAIFKELSWAYGLGTLTREELIQGLERALELFDQVPENPGSLALRGCLAFAQEDWAQAEAFLSQMRGPYDEEDSFLRWMLLVCVLEGAPSGEDLRSARSAYGAIRARYTLFPEYWYRGARAFCGSSALVPHEEIALVYAEQGINTSPQGPFAGANRKILAEALGLPAMGLPDDSYLNILTKAEIEHIIQLSLTQGSPAILTDLFPLMVLPENPYTLYALGALRALASVPEFRSFFVEESLKSSGRLLERLNYVSRG